MSSYSFYDLRQTSRKIQNAISGYSELENLIRELTNTDTWGPTAQQQRELNDFLMRSLVYYSESMNKSKFFEDDEEAENADDYGIERHSRGGVGIHDDGDLSSNLDPSSMDRAVEFIVERIKEYSIASSHGIFQEIKKRLVTGGYECVIISKCLTVLEGLLLHCYLMNNNKTQFLFDIKDTMKFHLNYFNSMAEGYECNKSFDNLNMQHTQVIRDKCKKLIDLVLDSELLSSERIKINQAYKNIQRNNIQSHKAATKRFSQLAEPSSSLFYDPSESISGGVGGISTNNVGGIGTNAINQPQSNRVTTRRSLSSILPNDIVHRMSSVSLNSKKSISLLDDDDDVNMNRDYETSFGRERNSSISSGRFGYKRNSQGNQYLASRASYSDAFHDERDEIPNSRNDNNGDGDNDNDDEFGDFSSSSGPGAPTAVATTPRQIKTNDLLIDLLSDSPVTTSPTHFNKLPKSTSTNSLGSPIHFRER